MPIRKAVLNRGLIAVTLVAALVLPSPAQLGAGGASPAAPKAQPKPAPPKSEQKSDAKPAAQKPAPATPAINTLVCPAGQQAVKKQTLFGDFMVCEPGPAAPPDAVNVQTAPPTTPVQPAATPAPTTAPGEVKPPEAKPTSVTITPPPADSADSAVALNLENADLYQVLRILGGELKINYITDPAVKGTVTINTSGNVSRKDLFGLLQMILEINGAAAVKSPNGYYSIVPLQNAKQQPANFRYAKEAESRPAPEDAFTLWVVPMKFISASEMSKLITPFMSGAGQIVVQEKGNIMMIEESAAKLKQLQEIINVFDDPVMGRQRVQLFPVTNNLAQNLVGELRSVFAGYGLASGQSAIQFIAMERLNSILTISASPEVFSEVEGWIKKLDQPARDVGIQNFVYKVQNAKAADLRDILIELYGGQASRPVPLSVTSELTQQNPAGGATPATAQPATPPPGATPTAMGPKPEVAASTTRVQGELRIMADTNNNSLIVQATPHDYAIVERTLREMDILPRQVLIDARIYEVNLSGDLSLGLSYFLNKQSAQTPITKSGSFDPSNGGLKMQAFALLPNAYQLQAFLTAQENRTKIKTLSAPSILVTDNTTARIQVGSEVPVPIGSSLTPVQSGGSSIFAQTIQFRDTGVILAVTPRVNASGVVTLDINQEVSNAAPNSTSGIVAPVINKSQFQTKVVLHDGQTLALGGIITDSLTTSRNRIPLIGDIPGVGILFGSTSRGVARKELVMMITPHVAQDMDQGATVSAEFVGKMRELKKDLQKSISPAK